MHEDVSELDGGPIDLSKMPLRDLSGLSGSALDGELARLLGREDADEKAAGFQNRI